MKHFANDGNRASAKETHHEGAKSPKSIPQRWMEIDVNQRHPVILRVFSYGFVAGLRQCYFDMPKLSTGLRWDPVTHLEHHRLLYLHKPEDFPGL